MKKRLEKLQSKLEKDSAMSEKLFSLETPEEVQELLKKEGLIKALAVQQSGELSDEDLEDVAGGFIVASFLMLFAAMGACIGMAFLTEGSRRW